MMHVVNADVGREPPQRRGQHIVRTACQRRIMQLPILGLRPVGLFKLVLHIKQPNPDRGGNQRCGNIDQKHRHQPAHPDHDGQPDGNHGIGAHGRGPIAPSGIHQAKRQAILQNKQKAGSKHEQNNGVAVGAIQKPPHPRPRAILFYRQCQHIANAAFVQIAVMRVVDRMRAPPHIIGGQGQHAQTAAHPILQFAIGEIRRMAAVMLNNKDPHQKRAVQNRQPKGQPIADRQRQPRQHPQHDKGHQSGHQFEH